MTLIALGRHLCRMLTTCAVVCLAGAVASLALGAAAYWAATLGWIVLAVLSLRVDNENCCANTAKIEKGRP